MKRQIKECLKRARKLKRRLELVQADKRMCCLHPDWADLTEMERRKIRWWDVYAHKCYKNIYGKYSTQFVSDALYQTQILTRLNAVNYTDSGMLHKDVVFCDKNYQDIFVDHAMFPNVVLRNIEGEFYDADFHHISLNNAVELCSGYSRLVFKNSTGAGHGVGVRVIHKKDYAVYMRSSGRDYIVQEIMKQHQSLAYYNDSSVNVIRITSLFWKGRVYILGGVLRIGAPGGFCDHLSKDGQYPLVIPVEEGGRLGKKAIDCDNGFVYDNVRGRKIGNFIPGYLKMKEFAKKTHIKYPHHKIIGWDLTLDEAGNIRCIEYNADCPGIVQSQFALGPIFSQKTERGNSLLDEILQG